MRRFVLLGGWALAVGVALGTGCSSTGIGQPPGTTTGGEAAGGTGGTGGTGGGAATGGTGGVAATGGTAGTAGSGGTAGTGGEGGGGGGSGPTCGDNPVVTAIESPPAAPIITWWDLEGFPGARDVADRLGNHYACMQGNSVDKVKFVPGRVGQSFAFDGVSDSFCRCQSPSNKICIDADGLDLLSGWTLSAWIKRAKTGVSETVIEKVGGYGIRIDDQDRFSAHVGDGDAPGAKCQVATPLAKDVWYHLAAEFDPAADSLRCYLDGTLAAENKSATVAMVATTATVRVGATTQTTRNFAGLIDEVIVHGAPIGAQQIERIYRRADHNVFNVRDFGAVGDDLADDTNALQSAVAKAMRHGTAVELPKGTYRVTQPILAAMGGYTWLSSLRITGDGATVKATTQMSAVLRIENGVSHFTLSSLTLDANHLASNALWAFKISGARAVVQDVVAKNAVADGVSLGSCQGSSWRNLRSEQNGGAGFNIDSCNAASFEQVEASNNGGSGFVTDDTAMSGVMFMRGVRALGNAGHGVLFKSRGAVLREGFIAGNVGHGVMVDGLGSTMVIGTTVSGAGNGTNRAICLHCEGPVDNNSGGHRILDNTLYSSADASYAAVGDKGKLPSVVSGTSMAPSAPTAPPVVPAPPLARHHGQMLNVRSYGAVGDGVADDTPAMMQAIADAVVDEHDVYLPRGSYLITQPLVLSSPCPVRLVGEFARIVVSGSMPAAVSLSGATELHRLYVAAAQATVTAAVDATAASAPILARQLEVEAGAGAGVRIDGASGVAVLESAAAGAPGWHCVGCDEVRFEVVQGFGGAGVGFFVEQSGAAQGVTIVHADAELNAEHGIVIAQEGTSVLDTWVEGNGLDGVRVQAPGAVLQGIRFIVAPDPNRPVRLLAGAKDAEVRGNTLDGGSAGQVWVRTVRDETGDGTATIAANFYGVALMYALLSDVHTPYANPCLGKENQKACIEELQKCLSPNPLDPSLCL